MVVRRNPVKKKGELGYLLTNQLEVVLGVNTHIHLAIKSIWYQNSIDSGV